MDDRRTTGAGQATDPERSSRAANAPGSAGIAEAALEALFHGTSTDALVLVDDRLRIVRVGPLAADLAERRPDELPGMSLIAAFGSVALDSLVRDALGGDAPAEEELTLGHLASRVFRAEAIPLRGAGILLFLHDMTGIRRVERMRRDFIANISHELRTPLTSVKLIAETLASGAVDDLATARDFAMQVERETDHLAQLVDELLELSQIESGEVRLELEETDPAGVVASVVERMMPLAERRRVRLVTVPPTGAESVRVAADATRLGQAIVNLVHNAVKFSHPGSEVRIGWEVEGRRVRFLVVDRGIGIPASHLPRIFERFYKVDRSRAREPQADPEELRAGSAGLGLAIVRHIAEAHGGRVGVESEVGVGSTFWIELPLAAAPRG
jgi:two-component system, OmpR family, phosphate regulon sensor histidine kinase PhoR